MTKIEKATNREETKSAKQRSISKDKYPLKPPALFAWIAAAATISLIILTQFLPRGHNPYLRGIGVFVLLLAAVFIFTPLYLLAKYGRVGSGQAKMAAGIIVDRGLYAITRHPQYLGYMFLAWGFTFVVQHWALVLLAVIAATSFYLQAVREEKYCLVEFGEPYECYRRRVPRFNILLGSVRLLRRRRQLIEEE